MSAPADSTPIDFRRQVWPPAKRSRSVSDPRPSDSPKVENLTSEPSPSTRDLQFFVQTGSKSLVVRARPDDTVDTVLHRVAEDFGTARCSPRFLSHHRLLLSGRTLPAECTLAQCRVADNSLLHLSSRLVSTRRPRAFYLASAVASAASPNSRFMFVVDHFIREFLSEALDRSRFSNVPTSPTDTAVCELDAEPFMCFVHAGAATALVRLYTSDLFWCRTIAERAIHVFVSPSPDLLPSDVHVCCFPVLLEFAKLLEAAVGCQDKLYLSCRAAAASIIHSTSWRILQHNLLDINVVAELEPFARNLYEKVICGLKSTQFDIPSSDMDDFFNLLRALTREAFYVGPLNLGNYWAVVFHTMCWQLSSAIDQYLLRLDGSCVPETEAKAFWTSHSSVLVALVELSTLSGFFHGLGESLRSFLVCYQKKINALAMFAPRNKTLPLLLQQHNDILEFEARKNLALMMFADQKEDNANPHELEMLITRPNLLEESFAYITQASPSELQGELSVMFKDEEAMGHGVLREWFSLVCRAIFSPQKMLFQHSPHDQRRVLPNPAFEIDWLHENYFLFAGRMIALTLSHKLSPGIMFDRIFFLQLAGQLVTLDDIMDSDPEFYASCMEILHMSPEILDSDELGLTFSQEVEELGKMKLVELCPGGKDIAVNSANRERYIKLLIQSRFVDSTARLVSLFARGFSDLLSDPTKQRLFFHSLDLSDLDRMLGGTDAVFDVADWRANTEYSGFNPNDDLINWFWQVVEEMTTEQRGMLLFFWTSVKYLPLDGFSALPQKLCIFKSSEASDRLPSSRTCFYCLYLPRYPSISVLRDRLRMISQEHSCCSFGAI